MSSKRTTRIHRIVAIGTIMTILTILSIRLNADTGVCGGASITLPFSDVPSSNIFFCAIAEAYFSALTNGTDATHYSPSANVSREQMAAFVTRTLDQSLRRGSRRAALNQWWTPTAADDLTLTTVGDGPELLQSDGADVWIANNISNSVSRVRASDGLKLGSDWVGIVAPQGVLCAKGKVFVTGNADPGTLYQIDPKGNPGAWVQLSNGLGSFPRAVAYDGHRIWTANEGGFSQQNGSISIISLNPVVVTNVSTGFHSVNGIIYDGTNIWVSDFSAGSADTLDKLDSNGNILLSVVVTDGLPQFLAFDGANIWVPSFFANVIDVVRVKDSQGNSLANPFVIATLTGNGLSGPVSPAFDGQRILVTNFNGNTVSLWRASDLSPIGFFPTSTSGNTFPYGACSDGLNFWINLYNIGKLARF